MHLGEHWSNGHCATQLDVTILVPEIPTLLEFGNLAADLAVALPSLCCPEDMISRISFLLRRRLPLRTRKEYGFTESGAPLTHTGQTSAQN